MFRPALTLALVLPACAFAAGSDTTTPPKPTETTTACTDGKIWDAGTETCVPPAQESRLDDDTLYGAVREFAYAGQYGAAVAALDAMSDQGDDRVLTYRGFTLRKLGKPDAAQAFYDRAIARNPDNILARSYMGQGFAERGRTDLARLQLAQIRARGGAGSWAETALVQAIVTGQGYGY